MLTTVITPHPQPLPASGEGRQSVALAGVGFFGFNKQSSGHDIKSERQVFTHNAIEVTTETRYYSGSHLSRIQCGRMEYIKNHVHRYESLLHRS
ncbi:hypothetical protein, partial [Nostoc sp.]|uniref:hypothetical protein n=1 Tax=Nostoc sp. TaxID=1180 RepID=UPI002FF80445